MLRAVVAVVLGAALLATTLPAVETAKHQRTETQVAGELDRLESAVADLRARDQATVEPGARRVVTVHIPHRDWTHAGVSYVALGGRPVDARGDRNGTTFAWRIDGGEERTNHVTGVRVEAAGMAGDRPLVLREPGTHRIAVELAWRNGERRILVSRVG
jgi:hypothetical protein